MLHCINSAEQLLGGEGRIIILANTDKATAPHLVKHCYSAVPSCTSDMYTWVHNATYCNVRKTSRESAFSTASSNTGCETEVFGHCLVDPRGQNTTRLKVLIILICIYMVGIAAELFTKMDSLSTPPDILIRICCIYIWGRCTCVWPLGNCLLVCKQSGQERFQNNCFYEHTPTHAPAHPCPLPH